MPMWGTLQRLKKDRMSEELQVKIDKTALIEQSIKSPIGTGQLRAACCLFANPGVVTPGRHAILTDAAPYPGLRLWGEDLKQIKYNFFPYLQGRTRMNPVIQDILILELMLSSGEGVFIERGKSKVASHLTNFLESEEDLSSDHPKHKGAALNVRSAAKERRKGPCSFSPCSDDALLAHGATYQKKKRISLLL
ncbi:hypothetical protein Tco_0537864 [Tanacetum coccineum]